MQNTYDELINKLSIFMFEREMGKKSTQLSDLSRYLFVPSNCAICFNDIHTDCATHNECISNVHDTTSDLNSHIFINHWNNSQMYIGYTNKVR